MSRRLMVLLVGAAMAALMLAMAGMAGAQDCPPIACEPSALQVTKVVPKDRATGVSVTANVKVYFNNSLNKNTVTAKTFKLKEAGTTEWVSATRSVRSPAVGVPDSIAILNPTDSLQAGTTYVAVVTTGVKDVNGDSLDQNKVWRFRTEPPDCPVDVCG